MEKERKKGEKKRGGEKERVPGFSRNGVHMSNFAASFDFGKASQVFKGPNLHKPSNTDRVMEQHTF